MVLVLCTGLGGCASCAPYNTTNLQDGSPDCPAPVLPGSNMTARYAVIVSFGIYLNGTSLDDIAQKVKDPNPE